MSRLIVEREPEHSRLHSRSMRHGPKLTSTYRGTIGLLADSDSLCEAIGLGTSSPLHDAAKGGRSIAW